MYEDPHKREYDCFCTTATYGTTLRRILEEVKPTEIYNLGAQSHVRVSFDLPEYTVDGRTLRLLEAIRDYQHRTGIEVVLPGWFFGDVWFGTASPTNRNNAVLSTQSICLCKVYAHWQTVNYREAYNLFCNGILFNHESPRRGETFVTQDYARSPA